LGHVAYFPGIVAAFSDEVSTLTATELKFTSAGTHLIPGTFRFGIELNTVLEQLSNFSRLLP
jgi:hypothetical protein